MKQFLILALLSLTTGLSLAQDATGTRESKPFILGRVVEIESKILSERRTLNIYLPAGYGLTDTARYPVIYLLDGSADEDFVHVAGVVQFLNFPWVGSIPNSIVVGIANVDRRRDFTYPTTIEKDKKDFPTTGKSKNFISFLENELQPFIEENYKTTDSRTIIGQSLGGLLATEILFKKPQLFNKYIIVSPSLWWDKESLLLYQPNVLKQSFINAVSVFIAVGKEGKIMEEDAKKLAGILKNAQRKNITVNFEYFTNENHASILHHAVYKGLESVNKSPEKREHK
jgi:predicted alpha/beta superfamily hydrolase